MKQQVIQKTEEKPKQRGPNLTGIPTQMKLDFEQRSGLSFDDVRVHYNSDKPRRIGALAYTQIPQVHIGPGQERHLRHELGHVVQQKQGIVRPTTWINRLPVNDSPVLEYAANIGAGVSRGHSRVMLNTVQMMMNQEYDEKKTRLTTYLSKRNISLSETDFNYVYSKLFTENIKLVQIPGQNLLIRTWGLSFRLIDPTTIIINTDGENMGKTEDPFSELIRPEFSSIIKKTVPVQAGQHRRHIISFDIMKSSFQKLLNSFDKSGFFVPFIDTFIVFINKFDAGKGYEVREYIEENDSTPKQIAYLVANFVLDILNSNSKNLIADSGSENSALGTMAYRVECFLISLEEGFTSFIRLAPDAMCNLETVFRLLVCSPNKGTSVEDVFNTFLNMKCMVLLHDTRYMTE